MNRHPNSERFLARPWITGQCSLHCQCRTHRRGRRVEDDDVTVASGLQDVAVHRGDRSTQELLV